MSPSWSISGSYFEACNCDVVCPCRSLGGRPGGRSTYGVCQFALSWFITTGFAGPLDLSRLAVVMAGLYSDDETGSPWRVVLYVDERADAEQTTWLTRIFLGQAGGGTRRNFAQAIHIVDAVRSARIDLSHAPERWRIGVEGYVRVEASTPIALAEPIACGIPGLDRPGQELRADVMSVHDAALQWELRGRCGFTADFNYGSD